MLYVARGLVRAPVNDYKGIDLVHYQHAGADGLGPVSLRAAPPDASQQVHYSRNIVLAIGKIGPANPLIYKRRESCL